MNRIERFRQLQDLGCIACLLDGYPGTPADVHHIVDKGYRSHSGGDDATIPLCPYHHRGEPGGWLTRANAELKAGPSLATDKRAFVLRYGTERYLLAYVDKLIGQEAHGSQ